MEFLVRTVNRIPWDFPTERREELRRQERARANELRAQGWLVKLWRVPGTTASVQLWDVPDATALHEALTSLPMCPWMDVTTEALAEHPQERERREGHA